jgi:hypothetical protein
MWLYAFEWGDRVRILGGDGRFGLATPPSPNDVGTPGRVGGPLPTSRSQVQRVEPKM